MTFVPHLILADAAPDGTALGIIGIVLLVLLVGSAALAFFTVRALVRFVRRRRVGQRT